MTTLRPILLYAASMHAAVQDMTVRELNQKIDELEIYLPEDTKRILKTQGHRPDVIAAVMEEVFSKYPTTPKV